MYKETKEEAFYTVIPRADGSRCADCVFFQQVPGSLDGTCERVAGFIKRLAVCDNFQLLGSPSKLDKPFDKSVK